MLDTVRVGGRNSMPTICGWLIAHYLWLGILIPRPSPSS